MIKTIGAALIAGATLLCGAALAGEKPTIVLVHGAFETSDVWAAVQAQLKQDGYETVAVDLPGRPGNPLPPGQATADLYRDAVITRIKLQTSPVILVGHSFGGITVSNVAEAEPDRIKTVIYVAAYLPASGDSLLSLSQKDPDSQMGPSFRVSDDKTYASVDPAKRGDLFCNDCTDSLKAQVAAGIVDEPLAPPATPVKLKADRFGRVDKVYIHTAHDIVVSPKLQAAMVAATPVRKEITLQTGHAPFAKDPVGLARAIEASIP
jgi:pimeloyl-ACP methyl ester carboxylesterase